MIKNKNKKFPFIPIIIVFSLIIFFGIISAFMSKNEFRGSVPFKAEKIGIIKVEGVILDSEEILRQLEEFENDSSVKAIVLRINSPGGAVAPSQEIYSEVKRIRDKKKIITSMGSVAASGGYYIASASNEIYANAGTITGSIGVIMEFMNFQDLLGKIGVSSEVIKSGKLKDVGNPARKMTDEEREFLNVVILDVYEQFVDDISKGRDNLPKENIYPIADGRILTGKQALQEKLVDKIGTIKDAVNRAAELAGIKGKPEVIYAKKKSISFFDMFTQETKSYITQILSEKQFSVNYMMNIPK